MYNTVDIVLFGGSFNPIHTAHIELVQRVYERLSPELFVITPTFITPLKDNSMMVSAEHRLNMCRLAFNDMPFVIVDDVEILRKGKSYTSDTLSYLKEKYSSKRLGLIVGADMFFTLEKWHKPRTIFELAEIVTIPRNEMNYSELCQKEAELKQLGARCIIFKEPISEISSTLIRERLSRGECVDGLLPDSVIEYIGVNGLYREGHNDIQGI